MAKNKTETRKDEVRFTTSNPKEMLHGYLAKRVVKTWVDDFVDEETSEVVSIERNEVLFDAGKLIDNDLQAQIMFHITAGDITEVEVSNQRRMAFLNCYNGFTPYMVTAQIDLKNRKFLMYASSVMMAHEIATDFIELNYTGGFYISQIKEFSSCTIIEENKLKKLKDTEFGIKAIEEDTDDVPKEYYKIEANITIEDDREYSQLFIVKAKDVESAKEDINHWLKQKFDKEAKEKQEISPDFNISLKNASTIPCSYTIEKDFSMAYHPNADEC